VKVDSLRPEVRHAVEAAQDKKAAGVIVLDLTGLASFTDYFVLCTGFSTRQVQAISDEIEERLAGGGLRPAHREGYATAEWVLLDYRGFLVHVFTDTARRFYDLERLWRSARRIEFPDGSPGTRADSAPQGAQSA
jgi:ribosome-associated protein